MSQNGTFAVGRTIYPLPSSISTSTLEIIDKPIFWLLDYFASSLETYAGSLWTAAVSTTNADMGNIVGQKFPNNPFPYLQDTSITFPLFSIYRVEGKFANRTISFYNLKNIFEIVWVLPPLSMAQVEIISPFKNAVLEIITNRSEYGWDPNYLDGYNYGQAAGFDYLNIVDYTYVNIPHTSTNLIMEAVVMKIEVVERNNPVDGEYLPISAINTEFDLITDGYVVENIIDINSNYNPKNFPG